MATVREQILLLCVQLECLEMKKGLFFSRSVFTDWDFIDFSLECSSLANKEGDSLRGGW